MTTATATTTTTTTTAATVRRKNSRNIFGPWGVDELDSVVAVCIDDERWWPIDGRLADAINAGRVAGFNLYYSLDGDTRARLAPLFSVPVIK